MNLHRYFQEVTVPVQTCVVGVGDFGRSFLAQGLRVPRMRARIGIDLDAQAVAQVFASLGVPPERIRVCRDAGQARQAWEQDCFIAASDLSAVLALPIDVVVEATGHPEAGARHALMAVQADKHVALVTKEVDSVAGPILAHLAAQRGKVVTPVDGDQPSLLIGLVSWARELGFEIVAAGKSSEYDMVFDPASETIESNGRRVAVPGFAPWFAPAHAAPAEAARARAELARALPQRAVPDLCELTVVANATGLLPDTPALHAPIARIAEVPDLLAPRERGGLLSGAGRLDVFHCLRTADQLSFAGGVFVIVRCEDRETWEMLRGKGHVLGRDASLALLYLPRHLLGLEAATSIIAAAMGVSTGAIAPRPHVDVVARASADLPAGTVLRAYGHHHSIDDVAGEMLPAAPLGDDTPVPYYLVADRPLRRPVARGRYIVQADLEFDPGSVLLDLRRQQDALFFG
ncbi:homoserine dehydrogenase [Orrella sp. JC864]|uniref:NAD(P)H-dependent oxidoreductase n=1 Tax=Orrella sp. JC864 TaxID=3120298 RepID=UPI00300B88E4